MNKQTVSATAKKLIGACIKGQALRIIACSLVSTISSVTYVGLALSSKAILDKATGTVEGSLTLNTLAIIGLVLLQVVCSAIISRLRVSTSGKMGISIRKKLFYSLISKDYSSSSLYHSGDLLNRFTSDTEVVVSTASSIIPNIVSIITRILAGGITILFIDWKFAAGLIVVGITVPLICKLVGHSYRSIHKKHQQSEGNLKSFLQESFKSLSIIKSFKTKKPLNHKLDKLQQENFKYKLLRNNLNIIYSIGMYTFFTAGYFLVILWGAMGLKSGSRTVTYGSLLAFLQIISQLRGPLQSISGIMPSYYSMCASADRIAEIIDLNDELLPLPQDVTDAINDVFTTINAENISFSFKEKEILKDCSFTIKRGTITAVTGESGVGKSTLFKLMLGYYNCKKGKVTFDGKYDINSSTRSLFSYVPQGNMILSGSIRENLTICTGEVSQEEIDKVLKISVLNQWINTLPDGIDTVIGENALGISEGQAQRIAIARALLCDCPIILLDEATSAIDSLTEKILFTNIKKLTDKTIVFVSHRTLPEDFCDSILYLENGKIIIKK